MDVARHIVRIGFYPDAPDESVFICPLRLQKLLYYCQGWSLGLRGRPLFRQPIEAWTLGPVVRDVYEKFQGTSDGIQLDQAGESIAPLGPGEAALVEMVWREYMRYTPGQLVEMTHRELPWREARGDLPPEAHSQARLSDETMGKFFGDMGRQLASRRLPLGFPAIDPMDSWRAEDELERTGGMGAPAEDVFGALPAEAGE